MRRILRTATLAALGLCYAAPSGASFFEEYLVDPKDGMLDASKYLSERPAGFLPVPMLITEPAVGTGFGMSAMFFHESDQQAKQSTDSSSSNKHAILPNNITVVGVAATDNGSKGAGLGHIGHWYQDTLRYTGYLLYPDFNLDFYSLGGHNLPSPIQLNIVGPAVLQELQFRIGDSHWLIGGRQVYRQVDTELAESLTLPNPFLSNAVNQFLNNNIGGTATTSGLGLVVEFDSRDNPMSPQSGYNYSLRYTAFDDALGSDFDYGSIKFEALNYWRLSEKFNLGLRLQYDGIDAVDDERLPSYVPPSIDLRGIPAIRYQGNAVAVAEIELTWKVSYRWRLNTFTGTGSAASDFSELSHADSAESHGAGFRYLIARRYGFVMGADVARGPEESAFYIQAGSTW